MTENKRFTIADGFKIVAIKDNDKIMNSKQVCNKLNDLEEARSYYQENFLTMKTERNQLKEENNRQAKQLDNLYYLIEKQDWKTLKGLIQEFQECEKQLQKEWGTYGDFE